MEMSEVLTMVVSRVDRKSERQRLCVCQFDKWGGRYGGTTDAKVRTYRRQPVMYSLSGVDSAAVVAAAASSMSKGVIGG